MNDQAEAAAPPQTEDHQWERSVQQLTESLLTMPAAQRARVLAGLPEFTTESERAATAEARNAELLSGLEQIRDAIPSGGTISHYPAEIAELRTRAETAEAEMQLMYAAFAGSAHSPKNPREAKQAIEQMSEGGHERAGLELARELAEAKSQLSALQAERAHLVEDITKIATLAEATGKCVLANVREDYSYARELRSNASYLLAAVSQWRLRPSGEEVAEDSAGNGGEPGDCTCGFVNHVLTPNGHVPGCPVQLVASGQSPPAEPDWNALIPWNALLPQVTEGTRCTMCGDTSGMCIRYHLAGLPVPPELAKEPAKGGDGGEAPDFFDDAWLLARYVGDHYDWKPNYSDVRAASLRVLSGPIPAERRAAAALSPPVGGPDWRPEGEHELDRVTADSSPLGIVSDAYVDHTGKYRETSLSKQNVIELLMRATWLLARRVERLEQSERAAGRLAK